MIRTEQLFNCYACKADTFISKNCFVVFFGPVIFRMHVRLLTLTLFKCLFVPYDEAKVLIYAVMCRISVLVPSNVEFDLSRSL